MKQPHWVKVGLILRRELRDQFRDRRTIFMIAILPLLLYPLLSIGMLQVAQFLKKHPARVLIVVGDGLPAPCPWLTRAQRHVRETPNDTLLKIELRETSTEELRRVEQAAPDMIERGAYDAVVIHGKSMEPGSHDDAQKRDRLPDEDDSVDGTPRDSINESNDLASKPRPAGGAYCRDSDSLNGSSDQAKPLVYYSAAKDRSRMAFQRISDALEIWRREAKSACASNPEIPNVPRTIATSSAQVNGRDVSNPGRRHAALWSKILPFVVFVWALTGAFYPAIDLCAGEKERGTLETLLASAAERLDIVWGKLLTTMIFSGATAILNMICMIGTAFFVSRQFADLASPQVLPILGPPPITAYLWIILALIPITALFGSLAIALAAMARSTKEGQYYLMPLIMGFMPLMMLALFPTARLDFGTSLLPVTGVMLLLRHLMEGELRQVWLYALPVLGVTVGCCLLAIRWAVDQFSNESVLFRSSERFGIGLWLRQLIRERGPTPSIPEALLCGLVILIIRFFAGSLLGVPTDWTSFAQSTIVALVAFVAAPALLMTMVLTSGPRRTLLLSLPSWRVLGGAVLLAACLHPCATALLALIRHLFPIDESVFAPFQQILASAPSLWHVVLLMAVLPAICEELAFRGFILSGLRQSGARWQAVLISSVLFGIAHGAIQQSLMATLFGLLLGFLAIQTGSIFPCIAFHVTHNALGILASDWLPKLQAASTGLGDFVWLIPASAGQTPLPVYGPVILFPSLLGAAAILHWYCRFPYQETEEERWRTAVTQSAVAPG